MGLKPPLFLPFPPSAKADGKAKQGKAKQGNARQGNTRAILLNICILE